MPTLNEDLVFNRFPQGVQAAFVRHVARRTVIPAGTELYKFTGFDLYPVNRSGNGKAGTPISPWWCRVQPDPANGDGGLDGLLADAKAAGLSTVDYAREVLAVMFSWNGLSQSGTGMARIYRIQLLQPVYGFVGNCQRMPNDQAPLHKPKSGGKPSLKGGAVQWYIPNLTAEYFTALGMNLIP